MKKLFTVVVGFLLATTSVATVRGEDSPAPELSAQDSLSREGQFLPLSLEGLSSQTTAAPEVSGNCQNKEFDCTLTVGRNGISYHLNEAPYSDESFAKFSELSPEEQRKFLAVRQDFLTQVAKPLHGMRIAFGVGSLVKDRITQVYELAKNVALDFEGNKIATLDWAKKIFGFAKAPTQEAAQAEDELQGQQKGQPSDLKPATPTTFRQRATQRSHFLIHKILTAIDDHLLWKQPRLFIERNEFGGTLIIGGVGAAAAKWGPSENGAAMNIGLTWGYNRETKALVFELFQEPERLSYVFVPGANYGLQIKGGVGFAYRKRGEERMSRVGTNYYSPGFILSPYASTTEDTAIVGVSSGILTVPPFVGEVFAFKTNTRPETFLRLAISPILPGFIRAKIGSLKLKIPRRQKVENVVQEVTDIDTHLKGDENSSETGAETETQKQKIAGNI